MVGRVLHLSEPWLPSSGGEHSNLDFAGSGAGSLVNGLAPCLAHSKGFINGNHCFYASEKPVNIHPFQWSRGNPELRGIGVAREYKVKILP